jgi:hypothetical protein
MIPATWCGRDFLLQFDELGFTHEALRFIIGDPDNISARQQVADISLPRSLRRYYFLYYQTGAADKTDIINRSICILGQDG